MAARETVVDGPKLLESLRRYAITVMQATPATWRMLIEAGWNPSSSRSEGALRWRSASRQSRKRADKAQRFRVESLWTYGTTVWSSLSRVEENCPVTIGRPIQNTQFYVLDRRKCRVPIGTPGELYIGGDGLANGYLNRPELTNERFVSNPFDPGGGKLYRTGDEVRYRGDGEVQYLGRLDFQVKVRGRRSGLSE